MLDASGFGAPLARKLETVVHRLRRGLFQESRVRRYGVEGADVLTESEACRVFPCAFWSCAAQNMLSRLRVRSIRVQGAVFFRNAPLFTGRPYLHQWLSITDGDGVECVLDPTLGPQLFARGKLSLDQFRTFAPRDVRYTPHLFYLAPWTRVHAAEAEVETYRPIGHAYHLRRASFRSRV